MNDFRMMIQRLSDKCTYFIRLYSRTHVRYTMFFSWCPRIHNHLIQNLLLVKLNVKFEQKLSTFKTVKLFVRTNSKTCQTQKSHVSCVLLLIVRVFIASLKHPCNTANLSFILHMGPLKRYISKFLTII